MAFGAGSVVWLVMCAAPAVWLWRPQSAAAVTKAGHKFALANKVYVDSRDAAAVDAVLGASRRGVAVLIAVSGVVGVIGLRWWPFDQVVAVLGIALGGAVAAVRHHLEYAALRGLDACVGTGRPRPAGDLVQRRQRLGLLLVGLLAVGGILLTLVAPVHPYGWVRPEASLVGLWAVVFGFVALAVVGTRRIRSLEFDAESSAHAYLLDALCHRVVQPPYVGAGFAAFVLAQLTYLDLLGTSGWSSYLLIAAVVSPIALCVPGRSLPFRRRLPQLQSEEFVNSRGSASA
jgi:hypothetical protein